MKSHNVIVTQSLEMLFDLDIDADNEKSAKEKADSFMQHLNWSYHKIAELCREHDIKYETFSQDIVDIDYNINIVVG